MFSLGFHASSTDGIRLGDEFKSLVITSEQTHQIIDALIGPHFF